MEEFDGFANLRLKFVQLRECAKHTVSHIGNDVYKFPVEIVNVLCRLRPKSLQTFYRIAPYEHRLQQYRAAKAPTYAALLHSQVGCNRSQLAIGAAEGR